jgi:nitrous oxide reductase accessory protein NosL
MRLRAGIGGALLLATLCVVTAYAGQRAMVVPSSRDKCPVCGMFVKKYPDWMAQVVFKDGSYAVFDGAKDLFKALHDPGRFLPGRRQADIDSVYVTDYYNLRPTDGRTAFYVIGSDVYGPMGKELVPFGNEADAKEFLKDHKGREILRFGDVKADHLRGLD